MAGIQMIDQDTVKTLDDAAIRFGNKHDIVIIGSRLHHDYYNLSLILMNRIVSEDPEARRRGTVLYDLWRRIVARLLHDPELKYAKNFTHYLLYHQP